MFEFNEQNYVNFCMWVVLLNQNAMVFIDFNDHDIMNVILLTFILWAIVTYR